jgi:hypothetical protein
MTLDDFLARFPSRRKNSAHDWHVPCPAHADDTHNPEKFSLHVTLEGDKILVHCFAGCTKDQVVAALELTSADLFTTNNGYGHAQPDPPRSPDVKPTLALFAQLKRIKPSTLEAFGWRNHDDGIAIPYPTRDGSLWRMRYRTSMRPGAGFKWDGQKDRPLIPYGRNRLDQIMEKGELWLVEGESDAVTAWARGLPCLGIPGNLAVKALTTEDLVGIEKLWIVLEPGQSGEGFARKLRERLTELAYAGLAYLVTLPAKDLSDLHVLKGPEFWPAIRKAQAEATDLATWGIPPDQLPPPSPTPFAEGAGDLIARSFPPIEVYIENVLTAEGSGFIGGEEKLGKTYYALDEALSLAMGVTLCGRFHVPQRRRVLFIEEEDSPRRTRLRLRALARGHGFNPDDEAFRNELSEWARVSVWQGFTLDDPAWLTRLEAELVAFPAAVVYLDVLRKLTVKDLNKAAEASPIFNTLDALRRRFGSVFRVLHHYRKGQGQRMGRGSQEMGGSFVLGAWTEQAVYLEPIGRKGGGTSFDVQQKDGAASSTLRLAWESEGPPHDPTWVRLVLAEMQPNQAAAEALAEQVLQLLQTLPAEYSPHGSGISIPTLVTTLKGIKGASEKGVRRALAILIEKDLCAANDARSTKLRRYSCTADETTPLPRSQPDQEKLL